jgi:hypothetical protein
METRDELASRIGFAHAHAAAVGRTAPLEICYSLMAMGANAIEPSAARERIDTLRQLGVTWLTVGFSAATRHEYIGALRRFSRDVIARCK